MVRLLITGATGLLGKSLLESALEGWDVYATYRSGVPESGPWSWLPLDICDPTSARDAWSRAKPDVVVHASSIGSVDYAETHREEARKVNVAGTALALELSSWFRAHFVFISSNAVFDGETPPYAEDDALRSVNYYGSLKIEGERLVRASGLRHAIVRPILMYGWPWPDRRLNPVAWWVKSLEAGERIRVVDDVFSKPLYAVNCAELVWSLLQSRREGTYHAAGADHLSLYDFAVRTAEVFELPADLIEPVPSDAFPELAPRPRDTSFDTRKMSQVGVAPMGVLEGLRAMRRTRSEGPRG